MKYASRALLSSHLFLTLLLAAVLNISCGGGSRSSAAADSQPTIPVKLQPVEAGTVEESSKFVGTLEAQERVALKPEIEGRIVAIAVTSGGRVEEGETIVQLRPDRTQAQLESAIANINAVRSARATAQAELQAAEAERVKTEADLALQQLEFPRTERLVKEGAQSQNELDIAHRNLDFAIAALRAAEDRVEAARSSFNQMDASLQQAEAEATVVNETLQYSWQREQAQPVAGLLVQRSLVGY
ncbi:rnd family efflux transporter mfp subunit [Leptolyngbya sp. Heron Island J]|uniref:efflux RND transporter periplasmic adaptor subunit n=1 Tax=Leptolyngbya sp. Heron Island J TaxID=1385935 RepID=UPI0003B9F7FD|nr:biotin/lipoyl-binding protein [Leptolyngbya sp. Heron Island J]ESA37488.1 rnd family efflux transporter mfp subunit [Leptolyngbya sp. Heron Island J]